MSASRPQRALRALFLARQPDGAARAGAAAHRRARRRADAELHARARHRRPVGGRRARDRLPRSEARRRQCRARRQAHRRRARCRADRALCRDRRGTPRCREAEHGRLAETMRLADRLGAEVGDGARAARWSRRSWPSRARATPRAWWSASRSARAGSSCATARWSTSWCAAARGSPSRCRRRASAAERRRRRPTGCRASPRDARALSRGRAHDGGGDGRSAWLIDGRRRHAQHLAGLRRAGPGGRGAAWAGAVAAGSRR